MPVSSAVNLDPAQTEPPQTSMSIYLDHNATTPLRQEARDLWLSVSDELCGNPSSLHGGGRRARAILDDARERVAGALEVDEDAVLFTSGGTEANNLALFGVLGGCGRPREEAGLLTSVVEHSSVLEPARALERRGHPLSILPVDAEGLVDPETILSSLPSNCALVSLQVANNELGTLSNLTDIAATLAQTRGCRPWLHTDAVQALGRIPIDLRAWGADLASFSAHKVGGPVGVGVLVKNPDVALEPLFWGGGQEDNLRPGTENVAGIAAAALAIDLAVQEREAFASHTSALSKKLWGELADRCPGARLLGPNYGDPRRLPNTLNVILPGLEGRVLVTRLGMAGLALSAGSACASGSLEPSHVLRAMGLNEADARSGLRISLGKSTTHIDCKRAVEILCTTNSSSHAT
ncbi:MAG: cysteine desulfurase [Planctomycetota bacterium]|jgi:cysteine desulfurase